MSEGTEYCWSLTYVSGFHAVYTFNSGQSGRTTRLMTANVNQILKTAVATSAYINRRHWCLIPQFPNVTPTSLAVLTVISCGKQAP